MHKLAVVFPNRRQSVYFLHHLQQIATPPCFMPASLTIEELVRMATPWQLADNLTQGFALYESYVDTCVAAGDDPKTIPSFDSFFHIGETLIKDFRELDAYCLKVDEVCSLLYEIEAIDKAFDQLTEEQKAYLRQFWQGAKDKRIIQERFLQLWQRLPQIYTLFHERLQQSEQTTLGMAYRMLANHAELDSNFTQQWDHIAFIGFNAFNKAEEIVLKRWQQKQYASLWLDIDAYYFDNPQHEAGDFLRRNLNVVGLQNSMPISRTLDTTATTIHVIACDGQQLQAKAIAPWLQQLEKRQAQTQTGILLANESMLMPVLQSLPEELDGINVTMGYPLQQSAVYDLMKLYIGIQNDLIANQYQTVHHALVSRWLQHPLCSWPQKEVEKLQAKMLKEHMVQVKATALRQYDEASAILFSKPMADMSIFSDMARLCEISTQHSMAKTDDMLGGLLVAAHDTLLQLQPLFMQLNPAPPFAFLCSLLLRQLGTVTVAFQGEPLVGLQLMGLLETRGIDFDDIIILDASEGNLPRIKAPESFLPHNIRRAFGMTVPEHQDAIFAYVFYRLLQRSKSVTLVYNQLVSDDSSGEISRFVQQLAFESNIPITRSTMALPVTTVPQPAITIAKNEAIEKKLALYLNGTIPLSPSGINTWLNCRLQFYFRYIAKLKEPELLQDEVGANQLGSVVHKVMELLYAPHAGKTITVAMIANMKQLLPTTVPEAFRLAWYSTVSAHAFVFTGELLVMRAVAEEFVRILLQQDESIAPFRLESLEIKMKHAMSFVSQGKTRQVMISGYADRVDEKEGIYRMVDYKTGSDKVAFKSVEALFERDSTAQNKAALQTLLYSWLFGKETNRTEGFEPILMAARQIASLPNFTGHLIDKSEKPPVTLTHHHMASRLRAIEQQMQHLLAELFDAATVFDQTTRKDNCKFCEYNSICGRGTA